MLPAAGGPFHPDATKPGLPAVKPQLDDAREG